MKLTEDQQLQTLALVLEAGWITDWTLAVDGGANIGRWTAEMAGRFGFVHAFEPSPVAAAELKQNVTALTNVAVHEMALLDRCCRVEMRNPQKKPTHRSSFVSPDESGSIWSTTLDAMNLPACGLLKLDIEGAEHDALLGGLDLINRCRPVLIIEFDDHAAGNGFRHDSNDILGLLDSLGYRLALKRGPDRVFVSELRSS